MKKFLIIPVMVIILCLSLSACTKQYVGKRIGYNHPNFCTIYNLPKSCTLNTEYFTFDFTISEGDISGEYVVEGDATYKGQGGFDNLMIGGTHGSDFYFLLANGGEIIDSFSFMLRGTDLGRSLSFRKKFKCDHPFDAAGITYNVSVSG